MIRKYRTIGNNWIGYRNQRKIPFLPVWKKWGNVTFSFFSMQDAEQYLDKLKVLMHPDDRYDNEVFIKYYGVD